MVQTWFAKGLPDRASFGTLIVSQATRTTFLPTCLNLPLALRPKVVAEHGQLVARMGHLTSNCDPQQQATLDPEH